MCVCVVFPHNDAWNHGVSQESSTTGRDYGVRPQVGGGNFREWCYDDPVASCGTHHVGCAAMEFASQFSSSV